MAKVCQATLTRVRRDFDGYLKAVGKLEAAKSRHHSLKYNARDGARAGRRKNIRANEAIMAAQGDVAEAKKRFLRSERVLTSCMKKKGG